MNEQEVEYVIMELSKRVNEMMEMMVESQRVITNGADSTTMVLENHKEAIMDIYKCLESAKIIPPEPELKVAPPRLELMQWNEEPSSSDIKPPTLTIVDNKRKMTDDYM